VITGGYLAYQRHNIETSSKTVELAMDWRDIQTLAALSKYPVDKLLTEIKALGITSIGVFEETLADANALGEIYYAGGSGILRFAGLNSTLSGLTAKKLIRPDRTYILSYNPEIRKRIDRELRCALPKESVKIIGEKVIEVNESEVRLKDLTLGISEIVKNYLIKKGFSIIPRISNDPRYDVSCKISEIAGYNTVIFDGDEILGYPDKLNLLYLALKSNNLKYGLVEIVKQDGDKRLKHLMGDSIVRVHSIPRDELLKINKDEALIRFARAAKERDIRLIYIRPFLPPRITEDPVKYNLAYLSDIGQMIKKSGFNLGPASAIKTFNPEGWQILLLGAGVVVISLLLLDAFVTLPWYLLLSALILSPFVMIVFGSSDRSYLLEKGLALLAAIVTPAYAVISQYRDNRSILPSGNVIFNSIFKMMNVIAECAIGIFLIIGLLASSKFMLGAEEFIGVKLSLIIPILIVAAYFIPRSKDKILGLLNQKISVLYILLAAALVGIFGILLARSGNFTLPVPGFEKYARQLLEIILGVRPRTKEFLIGYPLLIAAGVLLLKEKKEWLWLFLAVGVIGPVSLINTFTHIHVPIMISAVRSLNGLILGVLIGAAASVIYLKFGGKGSNNS
jgi:hypothetical protein